jgi:hypothetical protein
LNAKDLGEVVGQMAASLDEYSSLLSRLSCNWTQINQTQLIIFRFADKG